MTRRNSRSLGALIDKIAVEAEEGKDVRISTIQQIAGRRAVGPLLFFPGIVVVSPLSLVPTLPTIMGVTVALIAVQLVLGRRTIWLPQWLAKMSLTPERTTKVLRFLRPVAKVLDKLSRPRLPFFATGLMVRIAACVCLLVAITMPPLELLPGASTGAGVIISTFGLALTTQDGVLMLAALGAVAGATFLIAKLFFL